MKLDQKVKSPCIGVCSTGIGDAVCRGCKRFTHEVIHWNGYSEAEKLSIEARLNTFLAQVVKARVDIFDETLLRGQMDLQKIRYNTNADAYCAFFELLRAGATQIDSLEAYGCRLMRHYQGASLKEIKESIDADFFELSKVHYERYF